MASKTIGEYCVKLQAFTFLVSPSVEEVENALEEAVSKRKTILVIGNCWVHYRGRASSKLEPGERILIIKEDGSLLVHRSVGYEPVNWQLSAYHLPLGS